MKQTLKSLLLGSLIGIGLGLIIFSVMTNYTQGVDKRFSDLEKKVDSLHFRQNRNEAKVKAWSNAILWLTLQEFNRNPNDPPPPLEIPEPEPRPSPQTQTYQLKLEKGRSR